MNNFTDVYKKARVVIRNQTFSTEWQDFLQTKCQIKDFLGRHGFNESYERTPEHIRDKIKAAVKPGVTTSGDVIYDAATNSKSPSKHLERERAATLKMFKHVYHAQKTGGQDVWVYSPPVSDSTWVFDEIVGNESTIKARLAREDEIFSVSEKEWMCSALMLSKKISEDTKYKLAGNSVDATTKDMVRKWFLDEDSTDATLKKAITKLHAGFKKIAICCNSNSLVFTDYPDWRTTREKYFGAAFRGGEGGGFPVIYLEGAFTRLTGNSGKEWLCVETIIHEMSHHEVSTIDHRYDHQGLKPNKATFPYKKAIANADSWGYFALDLAGYLSKADSDNAWK
ncbi:MAG: M35 family metallo-endopeptidase [Methylococcales bacterium]|nr:M35 family metallo-endopeptidase [Methylococcales bacterium]